MKLIITEKHVGDWVAYYIAQKILDFNPTPDNPFVLGLTGGNTVKSVYKHLVQFYKDNLLSFENIVFFHTGEYLGIESSNIYSFQQFINHNFFNHVNAQQKNIHFLNAANSNIKEEGARYEQLIQSYGGVHLWMCGLGDDAHLAFNEPGSSIASRTRAKTLSFETRVANAGFFQGNVDLVPKRALTIGIQTILDAKEVVILAQGLNKANALQLSIEEGINHLYPASAMQLHPRVAFVADENAVSNIRVRTYRYHKEVEAKMLRPKTLIQSLYHSSYALVNATVFDGERFLNNATIIIENNIIKKVELDSVNDIIMKSIDLKGKIVVPGYIDLQVNGCGGADINADMSFDTLKTMHDTCLKHGTTSFAPTLITASDEKILEAVDLINHLTSPTAIGLIAWHFEGPFISKMKKGIHDEQHIRKPSVEILKAIIHANIDKKILTLAPEENEGQHIKLLADNGVIVSLGHTNGTHQQITEKIPYGITMATHLYNAMRPFDSREPGAVGAVLDSKNIAAGIIVDGIHCNYASVDIAYKTLKENLFLVSDASAPAGTNIPEFEFGGRKIYHRDGMCVAEDGTLAGVAVLLDTCVRNLVNNVNVPMEEAFRMASLYPARAIQKDDQYGYIKDNYIADLTILDKDLFVQAVVHKGKYIAFDDEADNKNV